MAKYPKPLTPEEELKCFAGIVNRDKIILHNMRVVVGRTRMARRKWKCLDYDEVFSELQLCLLRCVNKFNPDKHFKFSTYLNCAINDCVVELIRKQQRRNEVSIEVCSLSRFPYKDSDNEFLDNIQEHLKRNQAMLPPRSIRLLRSLYLDDPACTLDGISKVRGMDLAKLVTQVRRLLKQLKAGIK